jgi:C4-dicarboxylate transporter DctQ subunit
VSGGRAPDPPGWWDRVERTLVGFLGAAALCVGTYQIVARYLLPGRLAAGWTDETVVYLVVWAIFIIASQLVRNDGHVRPDVLLRVLPPQGQRFVEILNCLVALGFCIGLLWYGGAVAYDSWDIGEKSSTGMEFPMWLYYGALPVGAGLMSVRYAIRLWRYCFRFDPARMTIFPAHEA